LKLVVEFRDLFVEDERFGLGFGDLEEELVKMFVEFFGVFFVEKVAGLAVRSGS